MKAKEKEQDFYFTFGCGQVHAGCYIIINGTWDSSRDEMFKRHGKKWGFQYDESRWIKKGISQAELYGYKRI